MEGIIREKLQSFVEVGKALAEIRDKELYKLKNGGAYQTFEQYCREVWEFSVRHAQRLILSANTVEITRPIGRVPANESQVRPLAKLDPEKQREAWKKVVETAPKGKVTAMHVQRVVREMLPVPDIPEGWIVQIEQNVSNCTMVQLGTIPENKSVDVSHDHRQGEY